MKTVRMMMLSSVCVAFLGTLCVTSRAQAPARLRVGAEARESVMVTVYNNNYGLVREVRRLAMPAGEVELEVSDVAEKIDPTSVAFKSLTAPDKVGIFEQNYRYDLLNPETLLKKFVGRPIKLTTMNEAGTTSERTGKLLSINDGRIIQFDGPSGTTDAQEIAINPPGSVSVSEVPGTLLSRPTLVWLLGNDAGPAEQKIEVSYLTNDMTWKADYVAVVNENDTALDMTGWVTLDNKSGAGYENAKLKLVAGDVQRVQERPELMFFATDGAVAPAAAPAPQFQEKAFFEYHLYTLGRATTLAHNETKQMTLLEGHGVPARKIYAVESPMWHFQGPVGPEGAPKIDVKTMIEFENREQNHLGMALPGGRVRVYKADTDKSLQLVGEDKIEHTPKDEKVRLTLGKAFDIVAERIQTDYRRIADNVSEFGYRVTIRNHKDAAITVSCFEHVFGDWEMLQETSKHEKKDAQTIQFEVPVPANGETVLEYRVRVKW